MTMQPTSLDESRECFYTAWDKYNRQKPLTTEEEKIVRVALLHPELQHHLLEGEHKAVALTPDDDPFNPFLHLSLHIVVGEQIKEDKPQGVSKIYHQLLKQLGDPHEAEHSILEVLAYEMHSIIREQKPFNEKRYLKKIKKKLIEI